MKFEFQTLLSQNVRWYVEPSSAAHFLENYRPLLNFVTGDASEVTVIKDSPSKKVACIPAPGTPGAHAYIKTYLRPGYRYIIRPCPATREALALQKMERIAVPVPRFVAVGMVSAFPQSSYSALISLTGDRFKTFGYHAYTLLKVEKEPRERLVPALQYLFTLLRRMHDHGFYHGDVNLGNILFDAAQKEFRFIDFHRSNSWGMGRTRDRTVDLSKVHHFLLDYFSRDEWFDLAREPYFRNDERLEMRVKSIWESVTRERMQGKAENIAREAIEGKRRFSVEQCEGYRVHSYRYGGYSPIELVQMVKTGRFPDKVHLLDTPASFRAAKKKWIELVRKTTLHPNGANPLALIGDKNSRSTLLIKEGPPPPYSLPQVFSLERFKQR